MPSPIFPNDEARDKFLRGLLNEQGLFTHPMHPRCRCTLHTPIKYWDSEVCIEPDEYLAFLRREQDG